MFSFGPVIAVDVIASFLLFIAEEMYYQRG
jgi:hypothetical protein